MTGARPRFRYAPPARTWVTNANPVPIATTITIVSFGECMGSPRERCLSLRVISEFSPVLYSHRMGIGAKKVLCPCLSRATDTPALTAGHSPTGMPSEAVYGSFRVVRCCRAKNRPEFDLGSPWRQVIERARCPARAETEWNATAFKRD